MSPLCTHHLLYLFPQLVLVHLLHYPGSRSIVFMVSVTLFSFQLKIALLDICLSLSLHLGSSVFTHYDTGWRSMKTMMEDGGYVKMRSGAESREQ